VLERNKRRSKQGVVLKSSSAKTVSVIVETLVQHPIYKKVLKQSKKYLVHNDTDLNVDAGDKVLIESCRPISKSKCWRLVSKVG